MKTNYYILFILLLVLFASCKKDKDDNTEPVPDPPTVPATWEWFKLKRVERVTKVPNSYQVYHRDSTEIELDSIQNKIALRKYSFHLNGVNYDRDSSVETFTYNNKHQLVLYEHVDSYGQFYITRMEFVRNPKGEVTKVLSQYKNGLVTASEGIVTYRRRLDTTFITYIDSTRKHSQVSSDAQDFYQVALVKNRVVYKKVYNMATQGKLDSTQSVFEYNAAGGISKVTAQTNNNTPVVSTYIWDDDAILKNEQKFLSQWTGNLPWFTRAGMFDFSTFINVSQGTGTSPVIVIEGDLYKYYMASAWYKPEEASVMWSKGDVSTGMPVYSNYIENYFYRK